MKIHFVCTGNIFRSRLAEAYLNSKQVSSLKATSSGIEASENNCGSISWYTQRIIMNNKITSFESFSWQQTSKKLLDQADMVVFIDESHYQYAHEILFFRGKKYFIWNIPDIDSQIIGETAKIRESERIFDLIKEQVDKLLQIKTIN